MRPLVYFVATSLDGFIAEEDGSFDGFPWDDDYGAELFAEFPETIPAHIRGAAPRSANRWFDAVVMGRATYEVGLPMGLTSPYPTLDQYVFSTTLEESPSPDVTVVSGGATDFVSRLKTEPGKSIWLCGGAKLAGALLSAGLVDEVIAKVNPVVFGRGIPLFGGVSGPRRLSLTDTKVFPSGHLRLHYLLLN